MVNKRRRQKNVAKVLRGAYNEPASSSSEALRQTNKICGLRNLGNSCYFNSTLQCLAQTPYLVQLLEAMPKAEHDFAATLAKTLLEMQSSSGVYVPSALYGQVRGKCSNLCNGRQHDAQEFLRKLLEFVRFDGNNDNVDNFADSIFCGELVSTITCQECLNQRISHQKFMDLSVQVLPVRSSLPPTNKVNTNLNKKPPTKRELKRQLKIARCAQGKAARRAARKLKPHLSELNANERESDIVVQLNNSNNGNENNNELVLYANEKESDVVVQCNNNNGNESDNELVLSDPNESSSIHGDLEQIVNNANDHAVGSNNNVELTAKKTDDESNDNLCNSLKSLEIETNGEPVVITYSQSHHLDVAVESRRCNSTATLAPRTHIDYNNSISVQSCLNNFTEPELMTGSNKVECDHCKEGSSSAKTDSRMQLLVSNPPAVLIVHFKRFRQTAKGNPEKLRKHVEIPLLLDMAPYCASSVRDLPNVDYNQNKLVYSLYGIVEHSGGLGGGHYTAYVKTRQQLSPHDKRWAFVSQAARPSTIKLPSRKPDAEDSGNESESLSSNSSDLNNTSGVVVNDSVNDSSIDANLEASSGSWYHISDSFCQEITEAAVVRAEAYLLFYERIY